MALRHALFLERHALFLCAMPFFLTNRSFFLYKNGPFFWCESPFSFVTLAASVMINMWPDYIRNLHLFTDRTNNFLGLSMVSNQYWAGRVYDMCVYYMTGTPEGSTESGFMEKLGVEPATPGLQGIALIHYTTGQDSGHALDKVKLTSLSY